jgi:hypothetical protein
VVESSPRSRRRLMMMIMIMMMAMMVFSAPMPEGNGLEYRHDFDGEVTAESSTVDITLQHWLGLGLIYDIGSRLDWMTGSMVWFE